MQINDWVVESLKSKGIIFNSDGTLNISFSNKNSQRVENLEAAIRQQEHIIEQQTEEQNQNVEIGNLILEFRFIVRNLEKMTVEELSINMKSVYMSQLCEIISDLSKKREDLRKDGLKRLKNIYKMLEKNNVPAANLASQAALDRMRRRWLINDKIIIKSLSRLETLKKLRN